MTLLPARGDLPLCMMSRHCPAKDRCYHSPSVRAIAVGGHQNYMETTPRPDGPCEAWRALKDWELSFVHRRRDAKPKERQPVAPFYLDAISEPAPEVTIRPGSIRSVPLKRREA